MTFASGPSTYAGEVVAANERGIQLATLSGTSPWLNRSQYGQQVALPALGALVEVSTDKKGFIRAIRAVSAPPAAPAPTFAARGLDDDLAAPADLVEAAIAFGDVPDFGPIVSWRDRSIIRQSSAKTAFGFAASRPDMRAADALTLAGLIEAWVTRGAS